MKQTENGKLVGFCWHVHHDRLTEWCWDYEERREFITNHKPIAERELRLKLFQPVLGELPVEVVQAREAYGRAQEVYSKAELAYIQALGEHWVEIEALHAIECPNCPWDGETILG